MRPGPQRAFWLAWLPALLGGLLLLSPVSCVQVSVVDEGNGRADLFTPAAAAAKAASFHDVAVTAIDFDPPLASARAVDADRVSLLAVIENKGNQPENRLVVHARLSGPSGNVALVESEAIVERLVPGETRVVRFHGLPAVPVRAAYQLDVSVRPVAGEALVMNNQRTYRVELSMAPRGGANGTQ